MLTSLFEIENLGSIRIETAPDVKPYPVRRMTIKEHGRWKHNKFIGFASCDDALLDLHVGDLITCDMSFYVCKHKRKWEQRVLFINVVKNKEV